MKKTAYIVLLLVVVTGASLRSVLQRRDRREPPVILQSDAGRSIAPAVQVRLPIPAPIPVRANRQRKRNNPGLSGNPRTVDTDESRVIEVLKSRELARLPNGLTSRLRLVSVNMKYPLLRIEETISKEPAAREKKATRHLAVVADHILVQLRQDATETDLETLNQKYGARIRKKMHRPGMYLVEFPDPDLNTVPDNVAAYRQEAELVSYAEPDYVVYALQQRIPDDPRFNELWGMHNTGQDGGLDDADIDAPEAWQTTTGNDVIVGVIDSGVDYLHEDLAANMWTNPGEIPDNGIDDDGNGYIDDVHGIDTVNIDTDPKDDNDHGTHCSGTIAGVGNNGIGVAGVCWNARIMGLKFLSAGGSGYTSDAIECIDYGVTMGAKVLNNSWGGGGYSQGLYDAIETANQSNVLFCAAAGNSAADNDSNPHYPSSYTNENVIAVAASTRMDELAYFSCYGATSVDLAAPGSEILSTLPDDRYASWGGTSMATPHVSGAAALLLSRNPLLSVDELRDALMNSVDPVAAFSGKMVTGGRLNVFKALDLIYGISFDSKKYFTESWATITIIDKSLAGTTNQTVSLSSSAGDAETLTLTETEPGAYLFTNRIWIAYGAAVQSNAVLEGIHDTDLYATYFSPFAAGIVTGAAKVHLGLGITITTPPGNVPYSTTNIQVTGINNGNVLVSMIVSNEATGEALPFSATNAWTAPAVTLATNQGLNIIRVSGTNVYGHADSDSVSISRLSPNGTTNFVSKSGSHEWPFTSWDTAATNIMAAIGTAADSNLVLVTNDTYYEEITIDRGITLRGANGAETTIIDGEYERRCATIEENAVIENFTLTEGYEISGGGVYMRGGELRNCIVSWNSAYDYGGGVYCERGGLINNCLITDNDAWDGGGIEFDHGGVVSNSAVTWNYAWRYGGGVDCYGSGTVYNCTVTDNSSDAYGGGVECWDGGNIHCSRIMYNYAWGDGGGVECFYGTDITINNTFISGNSADGYGGGVDCWGGGTLNNCTLTDNGAAYGGGVYCYDGTLHNTIIYYNYATEGDNCYDDGDEFADYSYSCTTPAVPGEGNITDPPVLSGLANPHLLQGSPCIDTGTNTFATDTDIDGQTRISGGTVDIGCDEWVAGCETGTLEVAVYASATNVAANYPVEFHADIQGVASQYVCNVGDGTVYTNQPMAYHAWTATGTYQVVLTAYNTDNPGGISATVTVHVMTGVSYVDPNGGHVYPYASWTDAARRIQEAIDAVPYGGTVVVTNGVYNVNSYLKYGMENRIVLDKPITVRSVNGPDFTKIVGQGPMGSNAVRCAFIGEGAVLDGFMLTNGNTRTIGSTVDERSGGGVLMDYGGTLTNCRVVGCSAAYRGGGVFCYNGGTVNDCLVSGNLASSYGGGVFCYFAGEINNSEITANNSGFDAGGVFCYYGGSVNNSKIQQNHADSHGGGLRLNSSAGVKNCLVQGNTADNSGGGMYCYSYNEIENCTITENSAAVSGGGMYVRYSVATRNTISWSNTAPTGPNCSNTGSGWSYQHSCLDFDPGGIGNTTNPPLLRDGWQLDASSPCRDNGTNQTWMTGTVDLAGTSRIFNAVVDMGAYEFVDSDHDGMPDYWEIDNGLDPFTPDAGEDLDHDGKTNLEEYQNDTDPNGPNSAPALGSLSDRTVPVSNLLTFAVSATDPDGTTPTLTAPGWEAMFTDHGDGTGTFAWTPTQQTDAGDHTVTFIATDGGLSDTNDVEIYVYSFVITNPTTETVAYRGAHLTLEWTGLWPLGSANVDLWQDTNLVASLTNNMPALTSNMTCLPILPATLTPDSNYWVSVIDADYPADYAVSEQFTVKRARVLIQAGDGGTSGYWGLSTNNTPETWSQIAGPASRWALRDIEGDNVLLQRTDGSWTIIWHLNPATGQAQSYSSVYNRGSAWSWIARSLNGDRILLQQGDGGAVGFWTVDGSWAPVGYTAVSGPAPGWIARSIQGDNVLLQKTDGSWTIIWHLNPATGQAQSYSSVYNRGSAWSWTASDLEGDKILLQAGDGGVSGYWTVDGGWTPVSYTPIYSAVPGWRVIAIDEE